MFTANDFLGGPLLTTLAHDGVCQQILCACGYVFTFAPDPPENAVVCAETKQVHPQCPNCSRTTAVRPEGA